MNLIVLKNNENRCISADESETSGSTSPSVDEVESGETSKNSQQSNNITEVVKQSSDEYSIIWCSAVWDEKFLVQMGDSIEELWSECGGTLEIVGLDGDLTTQVSQIENAIVMGYNQIIVGGPDNQSLENVVGEAMNAGMQE